MPSRTGKLEWADFVPKVDVDLIGLKPITLKEFDVNVNDKVYEGFIL